jgi:signal peptidase II
MTAGGVMRHKYVWVGSIVSVILVLDQVTKYLVDKHIRPYELVAVIPGFFNLTNVRNRGAAFSILSGLPDGWRDAFFISVTLIAVLAILAFIRHTKEPLLVIAFSLITGGAVGNVIDRVRLGEVIDFIQWYVKSWYWPSFNVADSAITVGVVLLAFDMLFRKDGKTEKPI